MNDFLLKNFEELPAIDINLIKDYIKEFVDKSLVKEEKDDEGN